MKRNQIKFAVFIMIFGLSLTASSVFSQTKKASQSQSIEKPLTLANVFNALTGKSSSLSIPQRNKIIIKKVSEVGVNFSMTANLADELRKAGDNEELITLLSQKGINNSSSSPSNVNSAIKVTNSEESIEANETTEFSPITGTDDLGLAGTWTGLRGMEGETAFLIISGSKGEQFTGVLKLRGFHVAVQGRINRKTRQLLMRETSVIETGSEISWTLSTFSGALSRDGKEMSGVMKNSGSDSKATTAWSFSRVD